MLNQSLTELVGLLADQVVCFNSEENRCVVPINNVSDKLGALSITKHII